MADVDIAVAQYLPPYTGGVQRGLVGKLNEVVSVKDYGAVGNGTADDTAAIQLAIDTAHANNVSVVYMPPGTYKITDSLWLDAPGNLRSTPTAPTIFNFTLALVGPEAYGNLNGDGAQILFSGGAADRPALWVGSGQQMRVAGIGFYSTPGAALAHSKAASAAHCAIATSGGSGGAHTTLIERCTTYYFRSGVRVAPNNNSLGDDNQIRSCEFRNGYIGVDIVGDQAYINSIYDCQLMCNIGVLAKVATTVNVFGGHVNPNLDYAKFTITASSATLADFTDSTTATTLTNQRFTVTLSSPDAKMTAQLYNRAALKTANFGYVPLIIESYVGTTLTLTLRPGWVAATIGFIWNYRADTDLQADIRACTSIFVDIEAVAFQGTAINSYGTHVESPNAAIVLHKARATGGTAKFSSMNGLFFNYYVGQDNYANSGAANEALFVLQQSHPWIELQGGSLRMVNCDPYGATGASAPIIIEAYQAPTTCELEMHNCNLKAPTVRHCYQYPNGSDYQRWQYSNRPTGLGRWTGGQLLSGVDSGASGSGTTSAYRATGIGTAPQEGYRPARHTVPYLSKADVALINASSPPAVGTVPLVYGETPYQTGGDGVDDAYLFVKSNHKGWSFGVNLTVSWSKKGFSPILNLTGGADRKQLFPGLRCNWTEDSLHQYIVTGVHDLAGFAVVMQDVGINENYIQTGVKTTTYTGTALGQQAVVLRPYGGRAEVELGFQLTNLPTDDMATGDGQGVFVVPSSMNGLDLKRAIYQVAAAGTTGTSDIQVRRVRAGTPVDMLSTKITIASGALTSIGGTAYVINTSNDDIATGDMINIDVDALSTTKQKGGAVVLTFGL